MDTNIWNELNKMKYNRHRRYFLWKNKLKTTKKDWGEVSKEEFLKLIDGGDVALIYLERWESTPDYKRLMFLLREDGFASDLLETYAKVKELALTGDSASIKNMIMLQKEIKKYRQDIDKFNAIEENEEEDDGLEI